MTTNSGDIIKLNQEEGEGGGSSGINQRNLGADLLGMYKGAARVMPGNPYLQDFVEVDLPIAETSHVDQTAA
jgi:hypothetical protein